MTLPALAAEHRAAAPLLLGARHPPLSVDISCSRGAQQQTRRTPRLLSIDVTDRRSLSRKLDRPWTVLGYSASTNLLAGARSC